MPDPNPIILYDGVCGFCNRMVQFVLKRDLRDRFRFATAQSEFARALTRKHGIAPEPLKSLVLVLDYDLPTERAQQSSTASISIFKELGFFWRLSAQTYELVPRPLRDWTYDFVARHRYRLFGKYDNCPLPNPAHRHKFLDVSN